MKNENGINVVGNSRWSTIVFIRDLVKNFDLIKYLLGLSGSKSLNGIEKLLGLQSEQVFKRNLKRNR